MSEQSVGTRTEVYLKNGGGKCPACSSESIEAPGSTEVSASSVYLSVSCNDCQASWDDVYSLSDIASAVGFDPSEQIYTKDISLDYGISIFVSGGASGISSQLIEQFVLDGEGENERAEGATNALESFLLALAAEGVDLETPAMKSALKTAVDSIGNHGF